MSRIFNVSRGVAMLSSGEKNENSGTVASVVCLLMAFAPVLDPYVIPVTSNGVRVVGLLVFCLAAYLVVSKRCSWTRKGLSLVAVAAVFVLCTVASSSSVVVGRDIAAAMRIAVIYFVYACCYSAISGHIALERFAKIATGVAVAATILLFVQYFSSGSFWDGRLPLPLSGTDEFMPLVDPTTGRVRPHGFFQEVSYYALYVAPVLMYAVLNNRVVVSLVLSVGLFLSSSLIGYVALVFALLVVASKVKSKTGRIDWRKVALVLSGFFFLAIICFVLVDLNAIPILNSAADEIARRANSVFDINTVYSWGRSSAQQRLLGNIALFTDYDSVQKLFGMGVGEYINVFSGVETTYGSSMVNMLLGFGVVGETALIVWLICLVKRSNHHPIAFSLLVVLALFTDNVLFGWYFFYLLSWVGENSLHISNNGPLPFQARHEAMRG